MEGDIGGKIKLSLNGDGAVGLEPQLEGTDTRGYEPNYGAIGLGARGCRVDGR